ncbi:MAG: hypothetical protein ACI4TM_09530 [Candidatus Cryptobacteroides sp.]
MKKILLYASAALLFAACAKEELVPTEENNNNITGEITLSFSASQENFGTKAEIGASADGKTAINWQSTDQISVFDGANVNCAFSTKDFNAETPTNCTFEGEVTVLATDYTAVYPYSASAAIDAGVISGITLPATQAAVEGSFDTKAALMAAKTVAGGRELTFQNLVGYVKVTPDFACTKIELCAASGEALAGAGSITFDAEGNPSFTITPEGALSTITLEGTSEGNIAAGKTYYIAVPVQTLEAGWCIRATSAADGIVSTKSGSKEINFKKNTVLNLGTLTQVEPRYVTFSAESEQTFTMTLTGFALDLEEGEHFAYRVGKGDWTQFTSTISGIEFGGSGNDLQLRGISSKGTAEDLSKRTTISFGTDAKVSCSGDIRTLVDYKDCENAVSSNARFCNLFYECSQLTSAPVLPARDLAPYCYSSMFNSCTALTTAPELPAKTLKDYCYDKMFSGCSALTTAPALPAEELAPYCYFGMFSQCEALTTAPELLAETLAPYCYAEMFSSCTRLKTAPEELSATKLEENCYSGMFRVCCELMKTPVLPDAQLAAECYNEMFVGCISLSEVWIKAKPSFSGENEEDIWHQECEYSEKYFLSWLDGVSENGIIYCTEEFHKVGKDVGIFSSKWNCYNIETKNPFQD